VAEYASASLRYSALRAVEFSVSAEERLRGGDRKLDTCLLVETLRIAEAEKIALALANNFHGANIGVYRFLCQIST
jgi:hypothetical protein